MKLLLEGCRVVEFVEKDGYIERRACGYWKWWWLIPASYYGGGYSLF